MISRWTGAFGLMSLTATNPCVCATCSSSRTSPQKRQSSRCDSEDPLLTDGGGADADELADSGVDEERRVIVAVAATRTVDEHHVLGPDLGVPATSLQLAG